MAYCTGSRHYLLPSQEVVLRFSIAAVKVMIIPVHPRAASRAHTRHRLFFLSSRFLMTFLPVPSGVLLIGGILWFTLAGWASRSAPATGLAAIIMQSCVEVIKDGGAHDISPGVWFLDHRRLALTGQEGR